MNVTPCGIDLAKNLFQVHGVSSHGKPVLRKQLRRDRVAAFFANLPPCLIGMEALLQRPPLGLQADGAWPHGKARSGLPALADTDQIIEGGLYTVLPRQLVLD